MITLNSGDKITLDNDEKYLFLLEVNLDDKSYYVMQKESDESFCVGTLNDNDDLLFVQDEAILERVKDYTLRVPV